MLFYSIKEHLCAFYCRNGLTERFPTSTIWCNSTQLQAGRTMTSPSTQWYLHLFPFFYTFPELNQSRVRSQNKERSPPFISGVLRIKTAFIFIHKTLKLKEVELSLSWDCKSQCLRYYFWFVCPVSLDSVQLHLRGAGPLWPTGVPGLIEASSRAKRTQR